MSETERISADVMQWQLGMGIEGEKYNDYDFPLQQFGGANVSLPNTLTVNHPLNTEKDVSPSSSSRWTASSGSSVARTGA